MERLVKLEKTRIKYMTNEQKRKRYNYAREKGWCSAIARVMRNWTYRRIRTYTKKIGKKWMKTYNEQALQVEEDARWGITEMLK